MPSVSVVIPSRDRVDQLVDNVLDLRDKCPDVEIIVVADGDNETYSAIQAIGETVVFNDGIAGALESWNYGASVATGDIFFLGADDLVWEKGWIEAGLTEMAKLKWHGVVGFFDGSEFSRTVATHYMISKSYACNEMGGVIAVPAYHHYFIDNEMTARATQRNRFSYVGEQFITHNHWVWGLAEKDEIYTSKEEHYHADQELFEQRRKDWFPNTWEPSIFMVDDKPDGWGRVAVSARVYKHPELEFFNSWGVMLTRLQPGDTLIASPGGLGAHLAAAEIVRSFLNTRCNSLLLVDDDMEIPDRGLRTMRDNTDNFDYDIVMGFCTHKDIPPHAVVLRLIDQPDSPEALKGEHYGAMRDVPDNSVVPVDAAGLAFTLIKRHVLEAMIEEYGALYTSFFEWGKFTEGEDIVFSRWCRENGFSLAVDTNVKVGHVGTYVYGWDAFHDWKRQVEQQGK